MYLKYLSATVDKTPVKQAILRNKTLIHHIGSTLLAYVLFSHCYMGLFKLCLENEVIL